MSNRDSSEERGSSLITLLKILGAMTAFLGAVIALVAAISSLPKPNFFFPATLTPIAVASPTPPQSPPTTLSPSPIATTAIPPQPLPTATWTPATLTITLQPIVDGMGTNNGLSGSLIDDHASLPFSPPEFGDQYYNGITNEIRGFITFDLSSIPAGSQITQANLYLVEGGESGNLDPSYFSTVLIESVNIDNTLDASDFDKNGILAAQMPFTDIQSQPIDIKNAVNLVRLSGLRNITLRLRFSIGHDNNNASDEWALTYSTGFTKLEIVILAP